ncbi:T9SS type A sorting domain-containing protein [Ulvibacter sp.]|nr:T9SS type A sorting domain-containing protein [Ulvibacter sp.]
MKNIMLLFLMLLSLQTFGQDAVYNFNSSTENFVQGGMPGLTATDGALVNATWTGSFQFVRTPAGLAKSEANYKKIRVVVENSTNITVFQVLNYDSGSTSAGTADKQDVTITAVALNSGFTTYDIDFPANSSNNGTIDRLGFRAKGAITSGTLRIAQIVLIETGNWVTNNNFETSTDWTASGADVTAGFTTTDPQEGTQSGTLTFTADQVGNKFLQSATTDFGETVSPTDINTTLWVKSSITGAVVSLVYSLKDATGAYAGQISTGSYTISAADTWELATFNKTGLTNTFNRILIKIKVVGGLSGTVISFDDVKPTAILVATDNSWTGGKDTEWTDIANWTNGVAPTATKDSNVQVSANNPVISATSGVTVKNLDVEASAALTVAGGGSLTVSGDFTNDGTVTLNSTEDDYSSLIVEGSATGDITYNRYVNSYDTNPDGGGWDLVGSPTVMTIANFTTANAGTLKVLGDDYAFSQYDNALGQWVRYPTASPLGSFTTAQGYSMATNAGDGATVAFTGAMQTTTQNINIIDNNDANQGAGRRWNLVSNPFPSYINGNTAAGATNFLGANTAVINDQYLAVYGWDGTQYVAKNLTDAQGFWVAPGQGFWVAAASTSEASLSFTPDMRTTTGSGDFVTGPQILDYHVALKLYNGETQKATTNFYFRDGLSLDLDPGYDAGAFNQSTKLSSRLAMGSQETAFSINAMGMDAMQNTRVPLEIRQNAGQAFTISIADIDLPEDIYVYLEDTLNGTLTSLKDQDFELVAQSDLSGVDRFFIVFKTNAVLSNGDTLGIEALNVYKANKDSFVTIAGITPELEKLDVTIYSILGQTVREKSLNPNTATQRVSTQGLASGLYIVQIKSGNQTTVKKIIVK